MFLQWKLIFQKLSLRNLILIAIGISIVGILIFSTDSFLWTTTYDNFK